MNIIDEITEKVFNNLIKCKELHVFDFDDTLINTTSMIKVINNKTNDCKEIHPKDYHNYHLQLNEYFDLSNFDDVVNPILLPHYDLFVSLYQKLGPKSVAILTARPKAKGIISFLNEKGLKGVTVAAVGVDNPNVDVRYINAYRKKNWIKSKLDNEVIDLLSFYDDNEANIKIAKELIVEYPDVKFNIKLVV